MLPFVFFFQKILEYKFFFSFNQIKRFNFDLKNYDAAIGMNIHLGNAYQIVRTVLTHLSQYI